MVEFLVHVSWMQAPSDLGIATLELTNEIQPESLSAVDLPEDWRLYPAPRKLADLGTEWVHSKRSLLLRVPSAVVEQEHNILINPGHSDIVRVTILEVKDLEFDRRLLKGIDEALRGESHSEVAEQQSSPSGTHGPLSRRVGGGGVKAGGRAGKLQGADH